VAGWAMKARTCLLFVCMIVVPALAMFSHHVPTEVWSAARAAVCDQVGWDEWTSRLSTESAAAPARAAEQVTPVTSPPPQRVASTGADATAGQSPTARARLAALGAAEIETRPLEGVPGMHVASCRVAIDAAGQLQRVFHAAAASPAEAMVGLERQVDAWRGRLAARADAAGSGSR
jgi:hypothetical protein